MNSFEYLVAELAKLSPLELSVLDNVVIDRIKSRIKNQESFRESLLDVLIQLEPAIVPSNAIVKEIAFSQVRTKENTEIIKSDEPGKVTNAEPSYKVLRWPDVNRLTGLCRSHVHQLAAKGKFPKPIKLGSRSSGWIESDIMDWMQSRIAAARSDQAKN